MSKDPQVRPNPTRLTDSDARHLLAEGLIRVCHEHGPSRVALEAGCDEKTIRRARDKESTLGLASFANLALFDVRAVAPLFEAIGKNLKNLEAARSPDLSIPCIVTRFQLELSVALEDGRLDHSELLRMRPAIEALGALVDDLKERLAVKVVRG